MTKHSVNLIIERQKDSPFIRTLRRILPLTAAIFTFIFLTSLVLAYNYLNGLAVQYNKQKREIEQLETKIINQKSLEGIYTLTLARAGVLQKLVSSRKNFTTILTEMDALNRDDVNLKSVLADTAGNVSAAIVASTSASMDEFIDALLAKERAKSFSNIQASGIVRTSKGNYQLTVKFKGNPQLLQ